eukprot:jgi/Chlat1/2614/Chrsp178S02457
MAPPFYRAAEVLAAGLTGRERVVYVALLLARLLAVLLPGYIHPDEFFQAPEVAAQSILGRCAFIPWEFQRSPQAARSSLVPFALAGPPYLLLRAVSQKWGEWVVKPGALLLLPRIYLFGTSLIADMAVAKASALCGSSPRTLLVYASAWPTLLFMTRTFSNTLETLLLALAVLAVMPTPHKTKCTLLQCLWLGAVLAFGLFARFTFAFFAAPLLLFKLLTCCADGKGVLQYVKHTVQFGLSLTAGFVPTALVIAIGDSLFYGQLAICTSDNATMLRPDASNALLSILATCATIFRRLRQLCTFHWKGRLMWTPINSLLYNIQAKNLSLHGLHPRYLHVVVNMPLMFGPVALACASQLFHLCCGAKLPPTKAQSIRLCLVGCILLPLFALSMAPHQEPRFLLPLLLPLCIVVGDVPVKTPMRKTVWAFFNISLLVGYGFLHQAGVVPATMHLHGLLQPQLQASVHEDGSLLPGCQALSSSVNTTVIFHRTYMPPRFLLSIPATACTAPTADAQPEVNIIDLAGAPTASLCDTMRQAAASSSMVYVVLPASHGVRPEAECNCLSEFELQLVGSFGPHFSGEELSIVVEISKATGLMSAYESMRIEIHVIVAVNDKTAACNLL